MRRTFLAAGAAALLIGACSRGPTRPIADGYTLHGVVTARDGAPLRDVSVLIGRATRLEAYRHRLEGELDPEPAP